MRKLSVVVGGQYGSEGKGAVAAHLARSLTTSDVNVRVAGPNAGHTVWGGGIEYKLRQIPVGAVTSRCQLFIAAGSELDLDVIHDEVRQLDENGYAASSRLWVHPSATIIEPSHQRAEQDDRLGLVSQIGSTGKGIGAARSERALRIARTLKDVAGNDPNTWTPPMGDPGLAQRDHVLIEGTQGYGLGLHTDHYPFVTSSDCRAVDFCAMAGVSPWQAQRVEVWVVVRPYPIRVAGNSGPLYGETTWAELGLPEERTTVTNKVRRVGTFDERLVKEAVRANGGVPTVRLALTMFDQVFPELAGKTHPSDLWSNTQAMDWLAAIEELTDCPIGLVGTGPSSVIETPERLGVKPE